MVRLPLFEADTPMDDPVKEDPTENPATMVAKISWRKT
jgi:hypothetical protein